MKCSDIEGLANRINEIPGACWNTTIMKSIWKLVAEIKLE